MNDVVFNTGGDWDSTTLYNNGAEVQANRLFVDMKAGRDDFGEPSQGGVAIGGQTTACINTQAEPDTQVPIFPGRLVIRVPRHEVVIENTHPQFLFETTQVWLDQQDITENVMDVHLDVDAGNNNVEGYVTVYKHHMIAADEVATINLF